MNKIKIKDLTYEEGLEKLDEVLEKLEEDLSLEESMNLFKMGLDLYNHCDEILSKTEGEIKILLDSDKDLETEYIREED